MTPRHCHGVTIIAFAFPSVGKTGKDHRIIAVFGGIFCRSEVVFIRVDGIKACCLQFFQRGVYFDGIDAAAACTLIAGGLSFTMPPPS